MREDRILVVDDNPANLRLAEYLLTSSGFEVRTVQTGTDAIDVAASFRPALVVLDLQLPGMDGFAVARQLKQNPATRDICVVAMTAYAMRGDADRARAAGCDGYLPKPIEPATFVETLAGFLTGGATPTA